MVVMSCKCEKDTLNKALNANPNFSKLNHTHVVIRFRALMSLDMESITRHDNADEE